MIKEIFLTIYFLLLASLCQAASATFTWTANTETDLAGYKIYYGSTEETISQVVDVGKVTTYTMDSVPDILMYYAATAYDKDGFESPKSTPIKFNPPPVAPGGFVVQSISVTFVPGN